MTARADLLDDHPDAAVCALGRARRRAAARSNVEITFGNVTFRPGARVSSDDDGVVVLTKT